MVTKKQKSRMYKIHANLRRYGHKVDVHMRMVEKRSTFVSEKEDRWLKELVAFHYNVQNPMFEE